LGDWIISGYSFFNPQIKYAILMALSVITTCWAERRKTFLTPCRALLLEFCDVAKWQSSSIR
jgi:hypothetical protein